MTVTIDDKAPIKSLRTTPDDKEVSIAEALVLLNANEDKIEVDVRKLPNLQNGSDKENALWFGAVMKGVTHLMHGKTFTERLHDEESHWTNRPTYDDKPITVSRLRAKDSAGITSGEAAVMKVKARMGLGSIVPVPLWHTGGYVTLKAPSNASVLELNRRIGQEKITLGRITNGMVFSNTGIYIQSYLVNFILAHVYDTSFGTKNVEELKAIILSTDLPSLIWGMVCAMYPDGYELREPCVAQITKCKHISEGTVNIARLRVVDTSRLSDEQLKHMSRRSATFTADEIEKYQSGFSYNTKTVEIAGADGISMSLSVPTIAEYEQVGFDWVDSTVNMVDQAFRVPLKGDARNEYITDQGRLATLRQFSHWIKELNLGTEEEPDMITDRSTIDSILAEFSADDNMRISIMNNIGEHIENSTIAIIGYPNIDCPSCGLRYGDSIEESEEEGVADKVVRGEKVPEFIPLDMTTTFFTLCEQRIQSTVARPL